MSDVLIFVFMYIVIIIGILLVEHMKREADGEDDSIQATMLWMFLATAMVGMSVFSPFIMKEYFGSIAYIFILPFITLMWFFVFNPSPVYNFLTNNVNSKKKDKMKKNKSLKRQIYKNYSRQHADLILKFYKLLLKNNYAEKGANYKLRPSNTKVLSLSPKELSYIECDESGYYVVDVTSLFIKFINKNIEYANKKDYADSLESLLLERENAQRIVFLLNVFEDEEKLKFLSRKEGVTQLKLIGKDLNILNYNISENIEQIVELNRKTKTNEMNQEFNRLRKNSFDTIEDMGEIK